MANVGTPDRLVRLVIGAMLAAAPFLTWWAIWANPVALWTSVIIGTVLIATSALGFCPIYAALGLSSKRKIAR